MKVNSLLIKTALAAAVASVSFGAAAATVDLGVASPVVLANEIFGANSDTTIVQLPELTFEAGDVEDATESSTIKLTVSGIKGSNVVFGDTYDNPANWKAQNIEVKVGGVVLNETNSVVTAGGTLNDNQITIRISDAEVVTDLTEISLRGFKVQGLESSLKRVDGTPVRSITAALEVREDSTAANSAFDNTTKKEVIYSVNGITLKAAPTSYEAEGGRARINVADDQKLFTTDTGADAAGDFEKGQHVVDLGSLTIARNKHLEIPAGKEDGTLFDFTGSDTLALTLKGTTALANYGTFTLRDENCEGDVVSTGKVDGDEVEFAFANTDVLDASLRLCAKAEGKARIPESGFDANMSIAYYNPRYTDSTASQSLGRVLRNGCQVTLFNLPNVNAADNAFIRFTNTSELSGQVNAFVWTEDGERADVGAEVLSNLDAHATAVFHTNAGQSTGVYLGDVLPEFAETSGRSRIVLQGAFPSCEALGLVRSSNGTLVNMTSTTYSDGINGLEENGTSNTAN